MSGAEGSGEGSADAILDGVEEEDNLKPPAVVMGVEDIEEDREIAQVLFLNTNPPGIINRCTTCPEIDINDDDPEVDVSDEEPVSRLEYNVFEPGNKNRVWGNEPKFGVSQRYVWRFRRRLQMECSKRRPAFEETWLLDMLKKEGWCVLQKDALKIAEKLGLDKEHYSYYPTVRVFLPDLQWGPECMPCCPNCKRNTHVDVHGFRDNHPGRIVIGMKKNGNAILQSSLVQAVCSSNCSFSAETLLASESSLYSVW